MRITLGMLALGLMAFSLPAAAQEDNNNGSDYNIHTAKHSLDNLGQGEDDEMKHPNTTGVDTDQVQQQGQDLLQKGSDVLDGVR